MIIKSFYLNSTREIIVKIVKEILVLFKVNIYENATYADYDRLEIINEVSEENRSVKTTLILHKDDKTLSFNRISYLHADESVKAGINRLIKLNLYHIFCED